MENLRWLLIRGSEWGLSAESTKTNVGGADWVEMIETVFESEVPSFLHKFPIDWQTADAIEISIVITPFGVNVISKQAETLGF